MTVALRLGVPVSVVESDVVSDHEAVTLKVVVLVSDWELLGESDAVSVCVAVTETEPACVREAETVGDQPPVTVVLVLFVGDCDQETGDAENDFLEVAVEVRDCVMLLDDDSIPVGVPVLDRVAVPDHVSVCVDVLVARAVFVFVCDRDDDNVLDPVAVNELIALDVRVCLTDRVCV